MTWEDLDWWASEDWRVVQDRLDKLEEQNVAYNPGRDRLFYALDCIDPDEVKVAFVGQDPYPDPRLATGLAFSIPESFVSFPPTLETIFEEYQDDLHLPLPSCGNLLPWTLSGVLLWNVFPTCLAFRSLSHPWLEWYNLSISILKYLSSKGIVIVLLGSHSRRLKRYISDTNGKDYSNSSISSNTSIPSIGSNTSIIIELSHPSPRGSMSSRTEYKFLGSRVFSRVNSALVSLGKSKIDWRLS